MSLRSERGFTLAEVLVAMMITLVALMGLLQSVQIVNETNLRNQMREEAVQVGGTYLNNLMTASYSLPAADALTNYSTRSKLRGLTSKYYVTTRRELISGTGLHPAESKMAWVQVHWRFKTFSTSLQLTSIKSQ